MSILRPHYFLMVNSAPTGVKLVKAPISYKPTRVERQEHHSLQHGNPRFEQHSLSPNLTSSSPIMSLIQAVGVVLPRSLSPGHVTTQSNSHCSLHGISDSASTSTSPDTTISRTTATVLQPISRP
jgi:hypothetical protein